MPIPKLGKLKISGPMKTFLCGCLVLLISYFTYFNGYYKIANVIYDESYDIIHAERYLDRMIYFDVNPPIGKMFIALGEKIFNPNKGIDIRKYIDTGCIFNDIGGGFSFVGVRFFPTLFAFLNALLFFLILYKLSKNNFLSLMFTSMYLFENSAIAHFRTAMLDSTMIFFSFSAVLYFLYLYEKKKRKTYMNYFWLGCLTGLATFTKMVGLISLLLLPFLLLKEFNGDILKEIKNNSWLILKRAFSHLFGIFTIGFLTYYLHIVICANMMPKEDQCQLSTHKGASQEYIKLIEKKDLINPLNLYAPMRDYFNYVRAPQVNLNETIKSNPLLWPLGIKNIQYAISSDDDNKNIQDKQSYLEFQGNAVNWLIGLVAIITSLWLVTSRFIFKAKVANKKLFNYILIFTSLYVGFQLAVIVISFKRPLFIHSYLLALFFSFKIGRAHV